MVKQADQVMDNASGYGRSLILLIKHQSGQDDDDQCVSRLVTLKGLDESRDGAGRRQPDRSRVRKILRRGCTYHI